MDEVTNVLQFPAILTTGPISVERVCRSAEEACETVLILGYDKEGDAYFASTTGDKESLLFLLETFKFRLMSGEWDMS